MGRSRRDDDRMVRDHAHASAQANSLASEDAWTSSHSLMIRAHCSRRRHERSSGNDTLTNHYGKGRFVIPTYVVSCAVDMISNFSYIVSTVSYTVSIYI